LSSLSSFDIASLMVSVINIDFMITVSQKVFACKLSNSNITS
jgi:hypothetical protein